MKSKDLLIVSKSYKFTRNLSFTLPTYQDKFNILYPLLNR